MISPFEISSGFTLLWVGATVVSRGRARADRDMQGVLDQHKALVPNPIETLSPEEARKQPSPADAVRAYLLGKGESAQPENVGRVEDRQIEGPGGKIKIRLYTPAGPGPFPVIVYYHGGGFVIADLDVYDATPRSLANAAVALVVSSHYRQGPEDPFPAAHEDAFAAYRWALDHAGEMGGDPRRIAVAGESAGGNLAAAVCLMARDVGVARPVHQLLVYPVADSNLDTRSYRDNADARPLNQAMMAWFFKHAGKPADIKDPRLGLLKAANFKGLPAVTIITAEIDPLRSEGEALAAKFKSAGVPVHYRNYDGVTHEFFGMAAAVGKARDAVSFAASQLKKAFG